MAAVTSAPTPHPSDGPSYSRYFFAWFFLAALCGIGLLVEHFLCRRRRSPKDADAPEVVSYLDSDEPPPPLPPVDDDSDPVGKGVWIINDSGSMSYLDPTQEETKEGPPPTAAAPKTSPPSRHRSLRGYLSPGWSTTAAPPMALTSYLRDQMTDDRATDAEHRCHLTLSTERPAALEDEARPGALVRR